MLKTRRQVLLIAGLVLLLLAFLHWFTFGINILELLVAFATFTLAFAFCLLMLSLLFRHKALFVIALVSTTSTYILINPGLRLGDYSSSETDFSIVQANLYHGNEDVGEAITKLMEIGPDIISIQELNSQWENNILDLKKMYPYFVDEPHKSCCYGIALYSKLPIMHSEIVLLQGVPVIIARIDVDGLVVTISSLHTLPPVFPNKSTERNAQLTAMAELMSELNGPSVVIGDFNVVSWDRHLQTFLSVSSLSRLECGFQPTYPMDIGVPLIPIDHITYSSHLLPTECGSFTIPGSDHKGISASFNLNEH